MYIHFIYKKFLLFTFFCFILSKSHCKEVNFEVNTSTAGTSLDIESSCCLGLPSSCLWVVSWTLTTFLGVCAGACNIDLSFSDAAALMMAANNASSHIFPDHNKSLISCTANGFETPCSSDLGKNLFMNPGE